MTSLVSAGLRFSKYCLVDGSTHWPPMKFLKVFIAQLRAEPRRGPAGLRPRVAGSGKDLDRAKRDAPESDEERQDVRSRRAVAPRPDRRPDAAPGDDHDGEQVEGEAEAAARVV